MDNADAVHAVEQLVERAHKPEPVDKDGHVPFVAIPNECELADLERFLELPRRIKRNLVVSDIDSFNRYWDKWGFEEAEIFADIETRKVRAVFDEHVVHDNAVTAMWGDHTVTYECPLSHEWEQWTENDRERMSQHEFAEFLEDRMPDVAVPNGQDLQDIITNFKLQRDVHYESAIKLQGGGVQLKYHEQNEPMTTMEVPEIIELAIPPFHNGTVYTVRARLRYRMSNGNLSLWYELIEPWRVLEHAFAAPAPATVEAQLEGAEQPPLSVCATISRHTSRDINLVKLGTV